MQFNVLWKWTFLIPLYITLFNPKSLGFFFSTKNSPTWGVKCEKLVFMQYPIENHIMWHRPSVKKTFFQPRPQGLLAFQYGGGRREDPGTQQKSREWFVHGEWKFIQNGGQAKEWEDLGTRSWHPVKNKQNGGRGKLKEAKNMNECTYKPQEYGRMI